MEAKNAKETNLKYKTVKWKRRMPKNIMTDAEVKLTGYLSEKKYPESFRLVRYYDEEDDREFTFLTNAKQLSALEVANLYKKRWLIEVFFKWIKQNITVKTLWGYSENAVKVHLWTAIISYLLIARVKACCNSPYSITEVATLIRVSALERTNMIDLISKRDASKILSQNANELSLFDDI